MNIWFDTTLTSQLEGYNYSNSECSDDCGDCALMPGRPPLLMRDHSQPILLHRLKQYEPLHIQAYNEHWLVCNPTGTGQIAVLDTHAFTLLEAFRDAHTLVEIMQAYHESSPADIEDAVSLFCALGFLQNISQPLSSSQQQAEQTLTAWLHLTNACNLSCQYCYISKTQEHMPDDTARRSVDAVFRSARRQHFTGVKLKYSGGEASLRLPQLLDTHDYAANLAQQYGLTFSASLLTNGVMLSQRTIDQLKQRQIGISISLDGIASAHDEQRSFASGLGSFKYVDRTITRLLANNVLPHILITVSQRNLAGLPALMTYILERSLTFSMSYYRENDCSTHIQDLQFVDTAIIEAMHAVFALIERNVPRQNLLTSLMDKAGLSNPHQHTCGVGRNYLVIDQRGGVAKCQVDIQHSVTTIEDSDPLEAIRNDLSGIQNLSVDDKEGCRTCEWRYWCTGGCPLLTYRTTGRYDIKSPNCHIYKALFPAVLRLEALRLLKYTIPVTAGLLPC